MNDVRTLIQRYLKSVRESFDELRTEYPSFKMRPLGLSIPRRGVLPSGRTYLFHGLGCLFEKDGMVTDMDFVVNDMGFGDGCRIDGFDAWRLSLFAESIGETNLTLEYIQDALTALANAGEIIKPKVTYGLYLLCESLTSS